MCSSKIRVAVVDDHGIVRESLRFLLEAAREFEVIGEASDGIGAVEMTIRSRPEVLLLDVLLPKRNGVEALREIMRLQVRPRVLMLTMWESIDTAKECLGAGACGYLIKTAPAGQLFEAIRLAREERIVFNHMTPCAKTIRSNGICRRVRYRELSARERQVLSHVAQGLHNPEVASALGISVKTVEKHRQAIMNKLDVHETAGITRYALATGLVPCGAFECAMKTAPENGYGDEMPELSASF